ncbi:MAG: flagellar hook-basal body complex protein FliE [Roseinatronobacter sp.]
MTINPALAVQTYDKARMAAAPAPSDTPARSEAAFGAAIGSFAAGLHQAEVAATRSMVTGADPHALVEALAATELAVETAVSVRNKVVEAYLEILRMPV